MAQVSLSDQLGALALIDDLRHRNMVVQEHLDMPQRRAEVVKRIRDYYAGRNLVVDDATIEQGVKAYFECRLAFEAPELGPNQARLANWWVSRGRWGRKVAIAAVVLGVVGAGVGVAGHYKDKRELERQQAVQVQQEQASALRAQLLQQIDALERQFTELSPPEADRARIRARIGQARANVSAASVQKVNELYQFAKTPLQLEVVDRAGAKSAVERRFSEGGGKSWFLIVEAKDADGRVVPVEVTSAETGKHETVSQFAVRVPQADYERRKAEKQATGHISERQIGSKPAGTLSFQYKDEMGSAPDVITAW